MDIDDTLYSYQEAHPKALRACFDEIKKLGCSENFTIFKARYTSCRDNVKNRLKPQGTCRSRLFAFQELFESLHLEEAYMKALAFEDLYWDSLNKFITLRDQFEPFFDACRKKQISVCAVSDMQSRFQIEKLKNLGVLEHIKFLVTSEEAGFEKPNPAIFKLALQKLNLEPSEVIMIGDNLGKDIVGAQDLGISAYLLEI